MDPFPKNQNLQWTFTLLILTVTTLQSQQRPIPQSPGPLTPLHLQNNVWVRLANAIKSDKLCLTEYHIDDPLKSHTIGLPHGWYVDQLFNNYNFKSQTNSELQEIKILGSVKAELCFYIQKSLGHPVKHFLTPDSDFYRNASLWCKSPNFRTDMKTHYFRHPTTFPPGFFLICGDRAWAGVPSLPAGGPCTVGRLTLIDPATPSIPKRVNEDPDPGNLKAQLISLTTINTKFDFQLLEKINNLTFKGQADWALARHVHPVSTVLHNITLDSSLFSHVSANYRAAIDYFMLSRMIGCVTKPDLCCLNFKNYPNGTKFAFYSVSELKNLFSAAKVPINFYSKDIFESIHIPFLPNWLKQILLVCMSSAFTYSLSFLKNSIIKRVFPSSIQNKKGGDVGGGTYEDMGEWRKQRDQRTDFGAWKAQRETPEDA